MTSVWRSLLIVIAFASAANWPEPLRSARADMPAAAGNTTSSVRTSFVPCESDGQTGSRPAPEDLGESPELPPDLAHSLAYYASADLGVLAPRGWHCQGQYGSNGVTIIVTPESQASGTHLDGPAVQLSFFFGDTSGRFVVAQVAARLFPDKAEYVQRVINEGIWPKGDFPRGPYPGDRISRQSATDVEFETPSGSEGMGTRSLLLKGGAPIHGMAIMTSNDDLILLDARMPPDLSDVFRVIANAARSQKDIVPFHPN